MAALGLTLPAAAKGVAPYESWVIVGSTLTTSGQLPWVDGKLRWQGAIGGARSVEEGYDSCRISALNAIAQLRQALDGFERLRRIVRLEGVLNTVAGFTDSPGVLNGATDLVNEVFGTRGRHTRMLYCLQAMPMDCTSLVTLWAEVNPA